jgi:hypothetical protein
MPRGLHDPERVSAGAFSIPPGRPGNHEICSNQQGRVAGGPRRLIEPLSAQPIR